MNVLDIINTSMALAAVENQTIFEFDTTTLPQNNSEEILFPLPQNKSEGFLFPLPQNNSGEILFPVVNNTLTNIFDFNNYFNNNYNLTPSISENASTSTIKSIIETTMSTVQQYFDTTTEISGINSSTNTTERIPFSTTTAAITTKSTTELWMNAMINYTSSNERQEHDDIEMLGTTEAVFTMIPLVLITLAIIFGNLLVVIAVFSRKSLRSPQNIYIVSLALTDMGVAIFVLPYNITTLVLQKWIFGETVCKLYLTVDVSLCCVSIFHLCAIGIDRYRAISDGINYVQKRNLKSVLWTIFVLWIIAIWIGSPPFLAVQDWEVKYTGVSCEMPDSPGYNFHLAMGGLFFPLIIMSVIYGKIYYAIKERLRERARVTCMELTSDADTTDKLDTEDESTMNGTMRKGHGRRKPSAQISAFLVNRQKFSLSKEKKAAKTLGIIMAAFIICWLPLGFLNVIGSLCPTHLRPSASIFHVFTWLGYINSALNPIIYGVSNKDFQKAFKRILHLDC